MTSEGCLWLYCTLIRLIIRTRLVKYTGFAKGGQQHSWDGFQHDYVVTVRSTAYRDIETHFEIHALYCRVNDSCCTHVLA